VKRRTTTLGREQERGVIILVVALVLLFIVAAFAALAIDLVTFYTARSEAQLAADSIALAGARVLANSGMTSDPTNTTLRDQAEDLAQNMALQEGLQNQVGGRTLNPGEAVVSFGNAQANAGNPHVIVHVTRADLPTFFARIWGRTQITVSASAIAEAYNPSGHGGGALGGAPPVAPSCVKPWLLPNIDPTQPSASGPAIFLLGTGAIVNPALLGQGWPGLAAGCSDCSGVLPSPLPGVFYPGAIDAGDFPAPSPSEASPACNAGFNPYQLSIAGCVQRPIACGATATINIDRNPYTPTTTDRNTDTVQAAKCLIHLSALGDSDSIDTTAIPSPPFRFLAGNANPVVSAVGRDVLVSNSLVTVPVYDSTSSANPVTVIGFLQLFLNPQVVMPPANQIPVTIVNQVGCGTSMTGQPILGNGASPVAVRLISQ
jgi:hypothetical protein